MIKPQDVKLPPPSTIDAPSVDEVVQLASGESLRILQLIYARGEQYGEEVLALVGERGLVNMIVHKAMRLQWSIAQGRDFEDRKDSWDDLIGYGLLAHAITAWEEKQDEKGK